MSNLLPRGIMIQSSYIPLYWKIQIIIKFPFHVIVNHYSLSGPVFQLRKVSVLYNIKWRAFKSKNRNNMIGVNYYTKKVGNFKPQFPTAPACTAWVPRWSPRRGWCRTASARTGWSSSPPKRTVLKWINVSFREKNTFQLTFVCET